MNNEESNINEQRNQIVEKEGLRLQVLLIPIKTIDGLRF